MTALQAHARALQVLVASLGLPRDEAHSGARILVDRAIGRRHAHLLAPSQVLLESQAAQFEADLARAATGEPLPYIVGKQEFYGRDFEVSRDTLIPRPETELLVEVACKYLPRGEVQVADLGTGSGILAVTLALEVLGARVVATDIAPGALEVARRNAARHGVADGVEFVLSDGPWLEPLGSRAFDALVSNPPYIAPRDIENLDVGVRDFEPRAALDGGGDGLDAYRILAREGAKYLHAGGFAALEVGAGQWGDVAALFEASGWRVEAAILDLQRIARVLVARR